MSLYLEFGYMFEDLCLQSLILNLLSIHFNMKCINQFWSLVVSTDGSFIFQSCHSYPGSVTVDAAWKTAKAFSIITFILAISVIVIHCISVCTINPERVSTHGWDSPLYLLTAFCQGMTLIIFSSNACHSDILSGLGEAGIGSVLFEESCRISTGAKLVISATSFWAAAGCTSFVAHKAEKEEIAEEEGMGLREPLTA